MLKQFPRRFAAFRTAFGELNRFAQEVVKRVFTMRSAADGLNLRLAEHFYGKLGSRKFVRLGPYEGHPGEKARVLGFIRRYLCPKLGTGCGARDATGRISLQKSDPDSQARGLTGGERVTANQRMSQPTGRSPTKNPGVCEWVHCPADSVICRKLRALEVESKYLDHWHWLGARFGVDCWQTSSFLDLLLSVYAVSGGPKPNSSGQRV